MLPRKNLGRALRKALSQPGYAWENFVHRLKCTLSYHLFEGYSFGPETVSLFLTYHCNLKCAMCGQWGKNGAFRDFSHAILRERLTLAEIQELINDIRRYKPNITLFGGEPLLYPDWIEVLKMIKKSGLRCNMVTNGTLIERWAQDIVDLQMDEIIFSLDGPAAVHDAIRGVPGTYQQALRGFQLLRELKTQRKLSKPLVNINCTLTPQNIQYLEEIVAIADAMGCAGLTFHHLLFLERKTVTDFLTFFETQFHQLPSDWLGFATDQLPALDYELLIQKKHQIQKQKYPIDVAFFPNLTDAEVRQWYSQFPFRASSYQNRCMSLWATAYIFPDGSVRPYHTMNYTPGNIREHKFSTIWNNPDYRKYRKYIKHHKCFAVCAKGCTEFFRY